MIFALARYITFALARYINFARLFFFGRVFGHESRAPEDVFARVFGRAHGALERSVTMADNPTIHYLRGEIGENCHNVY